MRARHERNANHLRWNGKDDECAIRHGWLVNKGLRSDIQRDDDQHVFETDDEALTHVLQFARQTKLDRRGQEVPTEYAKTCAKALDLHQSSQA